MSGELDYLSATIEAEGLAYMVLYKVYPSVFAVAGAEAEAIAFKEAYEALVKKLEAAGVTVDE